MESPTPAPIAITKSIKSITSSKSFHLRSPSLNSLRLRRVFDLFDSNHDCLITVDEITRALTLLGLDSNTSQSDLDSIIKSYVRPGNAGLTYDDFVKLHRSINDMLFFEGVEDDVGCNKEDQDEADLTEAFKVFDENGDGFISAMELQKVLGKLGFTEANELGSVKMMISSVDVNHDGRVDFSEFKDMMRAIQ
ncbi:calcium-binding protein CAST-like [Bidens hawaiensis]|uniref:calcium-binding protein CAST-like n=1 Tax=Bidens hawaiensis TaxID=980011 RepID=UPI00404B1004